MSREGALEQEKTHDNLASFLPINYKKQNIKRKKPKKLIGKNTHFGSIPVNLIEKVIKIIGSMYIRRRILLMRLPLRAQGLSRS